MKVMISQPTFLPWLGYFNMIRQVDKFVILDDVEFNYQSWQHRNNFKTPNGLELFTLPVINGKKKGLIKNIKIDNSQFIKKKFIKFIYSNYNKSEYFKKLENNFINMINVAFSKNDLLNFNIEIIKWCINFLNLKTELVLSSQLNLPSEKIEKIIDICKNLHADEYLSAVGSKNYINGHEDIFKNSNIKLMFHNYEHPRYKQLFGSFCDYACILDLIFNEGDNSLEIIKSGNILN